MTRDGAASASHRKRRTQQRRAAPAWPLCGDGLIRSLRRRNPVERRDLVDAIRCFPEVEGVAAVDSQRHPHGIDGFRMVLHGLLEARSQRRKYGHGTRTHEIQRGWGISLAQGGEADVLLSSRSSVSAVRRSPAGKMIRRFLICADKLDQSRVSGRWKPEAAVSLGPVRMASVFCSSFMGISSTHRMSGYLESQFAGCRGSDRSIR